MPRMRTPQSAEKRRFPGTARLIAVVCLTLVITALLYSVSLNHYFQSDDFVLVKWASGGIRSSLKPIGWEYYRPCVIFTFAVIYRLFALSPPAFRISMLAFHVMNCVLLSILAYRITRDGSISLVAPLLFACSFFNSEVLLWIASFSDVLVAFFCALTLLLYIGYRERGSLGCYLLSIASFMGAVFSKESAFPLLLALVAYDRLSAKDLAHRGASATGDRSRLRPAARYVPFALAICLYAALKTPAGVLNPPGKIAVNFTQYVLYAFLPFLTAHTLMDWPPAFKVMAFAAAAIGIAAIVTRGSPRLRFLAVCLLLFLAPPCLSAVAEARYLYLPGLFSSVILAAAVLSVSRRIGRLLGARNARYRLSRSLRGALAPALICALFVAPQVLFVRERAASWAEASAAVESILGSLNELERRARADTDVYLVNVPDGIPSPIGCAFIFRNGIREALQFVCGVETGMVETLRLPGARGVWEGHRQIDFDELGEIERRDDTLVLVYDGDSREMKRRGR